MIAALVALVETLERQRREVIELYIGHFELDGESREAGGHQNRSAAAYGGKAHKSEGEEPRSEERSGGESTQAVAASAPVIQDASSPSKPIPLKRALILRPHCQNPGLCSGYGARHCHTCLMLAGISETAAA